MKTIALTAQKALFIMLSRELNLFIFDFLKRK
jgi:hypothetical protein